MTDPTESFATPRMAAGALFLDEHGRILLVHPTYKNTWDLPGGYVEHGESPADGCRRELLEELHLERSTFNLLSVDWAPSEKEGDKLLFLFDCGPLGQDERNIRLDETELDAWKYVELEALDDYVIDRIARRIRSTLIDKAVYLENGRAPEGSL